MTKLIMNVQNTNKNISSLCEASINEFATEQLSGNSD